MILEAIAKVHAGGRAALRVAWLSIEILRGALAYRFQTSLAPEGQSRWLHRICRRVLPVFAVERTVIGSVPTRGLLVANHLSYLDIVLLGALTPCVFVAKSEVKGWPIFGWFARLAGTVFVDRNNRRDASRANDAIRAALRDGVLVVLFPEGTSSDGSSVLPFKSSLLESALGESVPISIAALRYELPDGDAGMEVCYWGEHTLVPHLLNLLSRKGVQARVRFSAVTSFEHDRKKLAVQLRAEVERLHSDMSDTPKAVEATRLTMIPDITGRASLPRRHAVEATSLLEEITP